MGTQSKNTSYEVAVVKPGFDNSTALGECFVASGEVGPGPLVRAGNSACDAFGGTDR